MFVKIQLVVKRCSKNFGVASGWQLVPSTITLGSKLNSFVYAEKIDVVYLSFDNKRLLPVSQVLRLLRYRFINPSSFVHVEKIDVVSSFDNEGFMTVSQVLRLLR